MMTYTYRKAKSEEREQCIELANYVFSTAHRPHDFETLIPKVYGQGRDCAPLHLAAVREDGRFRAEVAVLPEQLHVCGQTLNAGFIGTVCVHPKERGAGHMKRLMHDTLKELKSACDLAVLDGQRQRYEYFGFSRGSLEAVYKLHETNIRHKEKELRLNDYTFQPVPLKNPAAGMVPDGSASGDSLRHVSGAAEQSLPFITYAARANQTRPLFVERPQELILPTLCSFQGQPVAIRKGDQLSGYLVLAADDEISELFLEDDRQAASVLGSYLRQQGLPELHIHLPLHQKEACAAVGALAETEQTVQPPSRMFRIFSFEKVLSAFLSLQAEIRPLTPGRLELWIDSSPLTVTCDGSKVRTEQTASPGAVHLTAFQAQELFLSGSMLAGRIPASIPEALREHLRIPQGWFPLPLFWYPADTF